MSRRRTSLADRRKARERAEHRLAGLAVACGFFATGAAFLALLVVTIMHRVNTDNDSLAAGVGLAVFLVTGCFSAGFLSLWSVRK